MRRKAFQPEGGLSSKTSCARKFKELITHTPTAGVAGGALYQDPKNALVSKLFSKAIPSAMMRNVTVKMETPVIYFYGDDQLQIGETLFKLDPSKGLLTATPPKGSVYDSYEIQLQRVLN
jgi:hypothetical protein